MLYRRFGKTNLSMPVLSFGCMRSMHTWNDKELTNIPDKADVKLTSIVKQALSHGINHIETAHGYGSSELQLGRILPSIPRDDYILQTKATLSENPEEFVAKVKLSMKRLQVDRLDLLALHGINDHRSLWYSCRKNGCLAAARRLQDEGLVDHVGFSGHGPCDVILQALEHEENGGFDFFNVHWYYIFDANKKAIECAADRDIGTFIISPSDKGGYLHSPSAELTDLCSPLSPMLFNDFYCLSQKNVHTISIGASAIEHFDEHLKVLPLLQAGDDKIVSEIDTRLRTRMESICGTKRPDALWNKLTPWYSAPGNINLRMVTWLYNLSRGWNMEEYARDRYAMLSKGSEWVSGNNGGSVEELDFSNQTTVENMAQEDLKDLISAAHNSLKKR